MRKKTVKMIVITVLILLAYEIVGAVIPFVSQKQVSTEYKESSKTARFRTEGRCRDYAAVVEDNGEALSRRIRMFEEAKESIVLSTFDIRPGRSTDDIFAALLAAANRGVDVKVLVDGLYGFLHMKGEPMFEAVGSHKNVEIKFYNTPNVLTPWTFNGRMHDKYILIDHKMLLMGGRNTFNYFLGDYTKKGISYDREVLLYNAAPAGDDTDSAIYQVRDYFEDMWKLDVCKSVFDGKGEKEDVKEAKKKLSGHYEEMKKTSPDWFTPVNYEKEMIPVKNAVLVANPTNILGKEPYVWYELQSLMREADKRVYIHMPYAVFSKDMYEDMRAVAAKGIDVKLLINSTAVGDNFMASSDYTFNRKNLLDTGVKLYEFFGEHSSHGKSLLIDDDLSVIGSYNTDMRSTYLDTETMLVIYGEEFNQELEKYIKKMEQESLKVNADESLEQNGIVEQKELPAAKKVLFAITSRLFQLFRYLI